MGLNEDIRSIQVIGGYVYGGTYGVFLLFSFIAAVHKSTKMSNCYDSIKNIGRTMITLKSIYFIIFVHIFDTITDFLVILQWYIKGKYEQDKSNNIDFPDLNYYGCFIFSIIILLFYRILSANYVFNYYHQSKSYAIMHGLLQFLDISLFYEVYQSH
eukprot:101143_1